jgi:hypothetical protein
VLAEGNQALVIGGGSTGGGAIRRDIESASQAKYRAPRQFWGQTESMNAAGV